VSRVADALTRAAIGAAQPGARETPEQGGIRLFAPGQPAVVSPWAIEEPAMERPSAKEGLAELSRRIHTPATAEPFDPIMSSPAPRSTGKHAERAGKLVTSPSASPLFRVQYTKLAATLYQAQLQGGAKVVAVTSGAPGEGKTLTAANLALTLSEAYRRRVLLVDADLRRPKVHELFGVSNERGLSESLATGSPLPLIQATPQLSLLAAGQSEADPLNTLASSRMRQLIDEARRTFDWIIIDTPPVGLLPDAKLLASMTDGVLLVAMADKTAYDEIQDAVAALDSAVILGIVLNRVSDSVWSRSQTNGYYASYQNRFAPAD
jgi:capsular exopolysaccharide synthesis family protein